MKLLRAFAGTALTTILPLAANAVDVKLYGQVNKMLYGFNDGESSEFVVTDNAYSSTRMGVKGEQKLDNGLTAGAVFEFETVDNASNAMVQQAAGAAGTTPANGASATPTSRLAVVSLNSEHLGGLNLGRLATAIDGVLTQDLTGARDVMGAEYRKVGGGLKFQRTGGAGLTTQTVNSLTESQSTNRNNAVRYDSPAWNGLSVKLSAIQGGDTDVALFQEGKYGDFKTKGAIGIYFDNDQTTGLARTETRTLGSFSVAHSSGLAGTVALSQHGIENEAVGSEDPTSLYVKVGYAFDKYELAADYGQAEHFQSLTAADNEIQTIGLAGQMNLGNGVSLGLLARQFDATLTSTPTEELWLYGANMRVKF